MMLIGRRLFSIDGQPFSGIDKLFLITSVCTLQKGITSELADARF